MSAYFSNSDAAFGYQSSYCWKCKNWVNKKDGRGFGCAIMDLHLIFDCYKNHETGNDIDQILDFLIPFNSKKGGNQKCKMFLPKEEKE